MSTLSASAIATLLTPYFPAPSETLLEQLSVYLDLLVKWNARTNLSAIREPEEMVRRHFGESLFAAECLAAEISPGTTLLDLGSGAGFPGLPIALAHPALQVTLAESQNKKAAFLREVVRSLGIPVEVWANRVENLPPTRQFDIITLRAVDNPAQALLLARERVGGEGSILHMTSSPSGGGETFPIPASRSSYVEVLR
jgi:16S rRNA (guanine527-N7)-methyltransferase